MEYFSKIIDFLNKLTDILLPIVLVSLLLSIIFGPDTPFVGDVYKNVVTITRTVGEEGIIAFISIIIILAYLKK